MPRKDYLDQYSEAVLDRLSGQIDSVYLKAAKAIKKKVSSFTEVHRAECEKMRQKLEAEEITKEKYSQWLASHVFRGEKWKVELEEITEEFVEADTQARQIVSDSAKGMFREAANFTAFFIWLKTKKPLKTFEVLTQKTVEKKLKKNKRLLPEWRIDEPKDYKWNEKRVWNVVQKGIINGDSVDDVGKRLYKELSASNADKMNMFARTAIGAAQNMGKLDRMREAEDMGIKVKKQWEATLDSRTRDAHADLDGQVKDIDEPFDSILGPIMCPKDPFADPANVYNCRCTMKEFFPDYPEQGARRDNETKEVVPDMTYKEWLKAKGG